MKQKIITFSFLIIIFSVSAISIIKQDESISNLERKKLAQFPKITYKTVMSGDAMDLFETYTTDQIAFRDEFRAIKAYTDIYLLGRLDNNNIFVKDENIFKMQPDLQEKQVLGFTKKLNTLYDKYLQGMNVYYSIIPDKGYYLEDDTHLSFDYEQLFKTVNENIENMKYIDITKELKLEDYYNTDIHWRQENLEKVVVKLSDEMNFEIPSFNYTVKTYKPFYGAYYGQAALNIKPDEISVLSNDIIDNAVVYNYENPNIKDVYEEEKIYGVDSYDVFLSGATPFVTITNESAKTDKELIIFRDSFGSSIAPLLIESYSKITLIDIRYMHSSLIEEMVEFNNQDVLFLYSTLIIQSSDTLR